MVVVSVGVDCPTLVSNVEVNAGFNGSLGSSSYWISHISTTIGSSSSEQGGISDAQEVPSKSQALEEMLIALVPSFKDILLKKPP